MASQLNFTKYAAIIGLIVAIYGAVLSTINSVIQFIAHRRDRADVVLKVSQNMTMLNGEHYDDMKLTVVTATNRGKRPVTIQGVATKLLDSRQQYWVRDVQPTLAHEITESQSVVALIDEGQGDLKLVESYYVWDSVGRTFTINMVPWHRRLVSWYRRKFAPVEHITEESTAR